MDHNTTITSSKKVAVTFTLPSINFKLLSQKIQSSASTLFSNVYEPVSQSVSNASSFTSSRARKFRMPRMNKFKFDKKYFKIILPVVLAVIVVGTIAGFIRSLPDAQSREVIGEQTAGNAQESLAIVSLDRKFTFPLEDAKGKKVGDFDYVVQSAAIQKQIIVQGQRANAVDGRVFLILNLKITNNLEQMIQLNTRDYLRVVVADSSSEQLAADIHNDPVEVQAISTKYTRIGIAIDEEDAKKLIQLKVGEIDGTKQNIDLNFKF